MAITNGLCSLSDVKQAMNVYDSNDDQRIELAVNAASRMIEAECNRRFYADSNATARTYVALNRGLTHIDDISTLCSRCQRRFPGVGTTIVRGGRDCVGTTAEVREIAHPQAESQTAQDPHPGWIRGGIVDHAQVRHKLGDVGDLQ